MFETKKFALAIAAGACVVAAAPAVAGSITYTEAFAGFGGEAFDVTSPDVPGMLNINPVTVSATQTPSGVTTLSVQTAANITTAGYQTLIIDSDGNGSADIEIGYEDGQIFTQTRDGASGFNSAQYADGLGWTGKNFGSTTAGSIMFTSSGLTASGFTLTATGLSANALVAGFGIYSDQGLEGTVSIDGELVNFSGQGENVIFAGGDFFGDENVSIDSGAFTDIAIVPLPQAVGLAGAGIALMGLRRRRAL